MTLKLRELFASFFFNRNPLAQAVGDGLADRANPHPVGSLAHGLDAMDYLERDSRYAQADGLASVDHEKKKAAEADQPFKLLTHADFPRVEDQVSPTSHEFRMRTGDSAVVAQDEPQDPATIVRVGDSTLTQNSPTGDWAAYNAPTMLMNWYGAQSFIGYQSCAIIAQHWLVDKACTMPAEDAVRNGYELSLANDADPNLDKSGVSSDDLLKAIRELDDKFDIRAQLIEFQRFINIYGIRVCLFHVESADPDYYAKPFNIDGVTEGSYKGIKQIDPQYMAPMSGGQGFTDPTSVNFYNPSYWIINGRKYHRSHLVIGRGPQPADILKPTYYYGGIPLTQRIYERVYAAERTANEGPLLAVSKRITVLKTNLAQLAAKPGAFQRRAEKWSMYRDNYAIKVVGDSEAVEMHDTSLADLDSVIMTQYQLVSGESGIPATKLMGTSPKGFGSNGSGEEKNYHELLEGVHTRVDPLLRRHHQLGVKSSFGVDIGIRATWNRVDSFSALDLAELNSKKIASGIALVEAGVISPDELRQDLKQDQFSGWGHLSDEPANEEFGATPENLIKQEEASAKNEQANAQQTKAGAAVTAVNSPDSEAGKVSKSDPSAEIRQLSKLLGMSNDSETGDSEYDIGSLIKRLAEILDDKMVKPDVKPSVTQDVKPSVTRTGDEYVGTHAKLARVKVDRLTCVIESPKGTVRSGNRLEGQNWSNLMDNHYGYINGIIGADGEELDCFVGPNLDSKIVYVINQVNPRDGLFDEHKVMLGFDGEEEALVAYESAFEKDWKGFDSLKPFTMDEFREWTKTADLNEPA